jgi:hypothetical protein
VAARGGKSPRVSIVNSVYAARGTSSSPCSGDVCAHGLQTHADECCAARSSDLVTFGYVPEVVPSVPEAVVFRAPIQYFGGHLRLAADLGGTYISPIVVVDPSPNPTTHSHHPITR